MTRTKESLALMGKLAAIPAGYLLASIVTAALVRVVPVSPVEAVSIGFMSFFAIYAGLLLWAFGTQRPARMWLIWAAIAVVLGSGVAWSIASGGRA